MRRKVVATSFSLNVEILRGLGEEDLFGIDNELLKVEALCFGMNL